MLQPRRILAGTCVALVMFALDAVIAPELFAQATYSQRVLNANDVGLTISNFGFLGNNFVNRSPSLEYPLGTGYEHLVHGGLWIGAQATDGAGSFRGVTTAAVDINQGSVGASATEFTPAQSGFLLRSVLPTNIYYSPDAVSEQDALSWYTDGMVQQASGNPEIHRPLNVEVRQECLVWSFADYRHIVFIRYVIKNLGAPLADVWVGQYTEFASGPKNAYSSWPPSALASSYGSWYSKKLLAYDASPRLLREHRCDGYPIPGGCHFEITPYWAGIQLLTPPDSAQGQRVTVAAWKFSPSDPLRDQDVERYAIMSAGTIQDLATPDLLPVTGDPVELIALGPFPAIASGDSIEVDFALMGGAEVQDIQRHAAAAQLLYDLNYNIGTTPTLVSLARTHATPERVEIEWYAADAASLEATVYRSDSNSEWLAVGRVTGEGSGMIRWVDSNVAPGRRYGYRLGVRRLSESEQTMGEVWIDVPMPGELSLAPSRNPATPGELELRFTLPEEAPASLELLDIAGRVLARHEVGSMGAGSHTIRLAPDVRLAAGIYFARLRQGPRVAGVRIAMTR